MSSFDELTPREHEIIACGSTTLNYGIVGCGRLGVLHAQILLSQCQEIVSVCDLSEENLKYFFKNLSGSITSDCHNDSQHHHHQHEHGAPEKLYKILVPNGKTLSRNKGGVTVYASADEMASACVSAKSSSGNNKSKLDAVIIASNTSSHTKDAEPFIRAGIKVFLASPIGADLADTFDFIKNVGTDASLLQVGLHRRFDASLNYARQVLLEGRVGTVREVRVCLRTQFNPVHLSPACETLGLIRDVGVEAVDTFLYLTGGSEMPCRISCMKFEAKDSASSHHNHHTSDINSARKQSLTTTTNVSSATTTSVDTKSNTAFITFTTQTGVIGRIELSRGTSASGAINTVEVSGSRGSLSVDRFNGCPGPVLVDLWKEDNTKCNLTSRNFEITNMRLRPKLAINEGDDTAPQCADNTLFDESLPRFQAAYRAAHTAFRDDIVMKRPFKVTQLDALDAQVVVEAAVVSAEKGGLTVEVKKSNSSNLDEYHNICRKAGLC